MSDLVLSVRALHTRLGDGAGAVRAVDGVDLDVARGETVALLGESGCGKSMTALSIMRLLPVTGRLVQGRVMLEDEDLLALPEFRMRDVRGGRMAMIFQEPMTSLNPVLTIGAQLGESLRVHRGLPRNRVPDVTRELLEAVGIPDPARRIHEYPHQLSGGMKQRVMIAIALAGQPDLLIADEPTTAVDVTIQAQILELLRQLQREFGMSILLITHDLGVVAEMADRVAVMYAGELVEEAACGDFFHNPKHPYSRKLFESLPEMGKRDRRLAVIEGYVPSLTQVFPGCRFASRCDAATDQCHAVAPQWYRPAPSRAVRCHLYATTTIHKKTAAQTPAQASADRAMEALRQVSDPLLAVRQLKVHFPIRKGVLQRVVGHVKAVDGVSLAIARGRTVAVVGESGCGKTTVGKGILQLVRPTGGSVQFDGRELTTLRGRSLRRRRSDLQIIFQDPFSSMNPRMMIGEIIEEGMEAQGVGTNPTERSQRARELLEQVGLPLEASKRYPHEFSGGQRQRICIARALAVNPRLIICDEPTSALDLSVQAQILNLLKELQDLYGLAYLFISHNISVVGYFAHEVAVMYLGRIVERGTVHEVLTRPRHPYTQALLSAVPVTDPMSRRPVVRLSGDLPSPANPPVGCHFHPRCPKAVPDCQSAYPHPVSFSDTHSVHCLRAAE